MRETLLECELSPLSWQHPWTRGAQVHLILRPAFRLARARGSYFAQDAADESRRCSQGSASATVEMTHEDIAYFQEQRRPDRFYPGTTTLKRLHPIIIEGVPSMVQAGGRYE